jgi:hypothetical protein
MAMGQPRVVAHVPRDLRPRHVEVHPVTAGVRRHDARGHLACPAPRAALLRDAAAERWCDARHDHVGLHGRCSEPGFSSHKRRQGRRKPSRWRRGVATTGSETPRKTSTKKNRNTPRSTRRMTRLSRHQRRRGGRKGRRPRRRPSRGSNGRAKKRSVSPKLGRPFP